ncbi:MAG TPA: Uma2 family endonuclease [Gammaproteobacteria bacterium]|nr:Uma2 family endonuclease [Gammaproteobacteria bacterium]
MSTQMESWPRRHRITVHEYHRMAEVGVLAPDARVELIEGEIIDMAPIGRDHQSIVDQLARLLMRAVGDDAIVRIQGSVRLGEFSEPQPDVVLLKPRADFYRSAFATAQDALLVLEVGDSTLRYDRDFKAPFYARHGIAEAWVVDVGHNLLLRYDSPVDGAYRNHGSERVGVVALPGLQNVSIDLTAIWS